MTTTTTRKRTAIQKKQLFNSVEELKAFILWAKANGLSAFKANDIEFVISEAARTLEALPAEYMGSTEERDTKANLLDSEPEDADNDDELLYHSTI
jgi:hypothetical protein